MEEMWGQGGCTRGGAMRASNNNVHPSKHKVYFDIKYSPLFVRGLTLIREI